MIVYVCFTCLTYGDGWCDKVSQIVSDESTAKQWVEEFEKTDWESRFYEEYEVK